MSKPIRVLQVVGRMGDGGMESLIMNIYRNIDRDKVQFDFLQHKGHGGIFEEEIKTLGGQIYEMPVIRTDTKTYYWKFFEYIQALKEFFKEHQEYHVLHGHMTNTAAIYMPIAKKYGRVTTCIAHSHSTQARPGLSGKVTDLLHKRIPMVATDYFACSEMAARWIFSEEDILSGKVKIIKNGVDPKRFHFSEKERNDIRRDLGIDNRFVIGHVGRFTIQKNQAFLVDVFEKVHQTKPNSLLLLIGDGERRADVEKKVKSMGLEDDIRFMGIRKDIEKLMMAMDVFVLPSLVEGLPVVGIEAQAAGLPVVMSDGITRESDITGNVDFIGLDESPDFWAQRIIEKSTDFKRKDMYQFIRDNGYDITETAAHLQSYYLSRHNEAVD